MGLEAWSFSGAWNLKFGTSYSLQRTRKSSSNFRRVGPERTDESLTCGKNFFTVDSPNREPKRLNFYAA
jgi:hypothetical protein